MDSKNFFTNLTNGATWSAGVAFKRSNPLPLDRYSVFDTLEKAQEYASTNPVAYPGQVITVVEIPREGELKGTSTAYVISPSGTLQKLASTTTSGDLVNDITNLQSEIETLKGAPDVQGSVDYKIQQIVGAAPEAYDTLQEIAAWIQDDQTGAAAVIKDVKTLKTTVGDGTSGLVKNVTDNTKNIETNNINISKLQEDLGTANSNIEINSNVIGQLSLLKTAVTDNLVNAINNVYDNAAKAENKIEQIKFNGTALEPVNKVVSIDLVAATDSQFGAVKSSSEENKVQVNSDGIMVLNNVNVNKLSQTTGEELILNGGRAKKSV